MAFVAHSSMSRPQASEPMPLPQVDPSSVKPCDARELNKLFFDRLQTLEEGTHDYQYARNTLIEMNLSLVQFAAKRFRNRGDGQLEDIIQVGTIGLIKAIDRFDLSREVEFTSFAIPYIVGEIKRFFRDTSWAVHVPRRLQELRTTLARTREQLAGEFGREATVAELAAHLGISEQDVIEGLIAGNGYTAGSLEAPITGREPGKGAHSCAETIGTPDVGMELAENLHALAPLLRELGEREQAIISMRFGEEMTQAQIGERLGLSQMHISRILSRTLAKLRAGLLTES
ncbi:SigB/SigF/SigG family RNA polymerase sigma factor [Streptomyces sp. MBT56]|nr:SigB/SigF/SigG family RNA polymerase sigma factor [Streptomyces sp. MBT56]MBK3605401.1 SigB/SigF/SigG family RNA polymerase sigma factor [Streptomyces sp. MBT54]MBK3618360.1 SigB/SigF/SigG family RNA polymerase sigma factor [Streptomyces sp. MBT98]